MAGEREGFELLRRSFVPVPSGRPERKQFFRRFFTVDAILFISNKYRLSILHANDRSVLMQMTESSARNEKATAMRTE